jgi:electron transfer flavoprotein beta subunit
LKIIVCVKVVLDPEAPASIFKVDETAKKVIPPPGTPPVLNPFDENALEAALKIKDSTGASITILSLGKNIPKPVIRKSLATGADNLVLLDDETFAGLDSISTAFVLADAIKKIGSYDLILCGREAADTDAGQVGLIIAEILGIPSVSLASKVAAVGNKLAVEKLTSNGYETLEIAMPALVTVSSEIGTLRTASIASVLAAQKKPMNIWKAADFVKSQYSSPKLVLNRLFQPVHTNRCEIISGDTPEDAAARLALHLKNVKVL